MCLRGLVTLGDLASSSGVPRGWFGGFKPPLPLNSEDIGGVRDRMSKKNRRLDFLLQFTVFSHGCNLLNKGFF